MTTYYVDGVSGNDGNAGTSFGAAWQTIAHAAATLVAGDTVNICATGTYTLTSTVTWATTGSAGSPITVTGANATGTVDGTQPTITSSTNSVALLTIGNIAGYIVFRYLKLTHTAATRGKGIVKSNDSATPLDVAVQNCVIDGCSNGIEGDNSVTSWISGLTVSNTEIKNCTGSGVVSTSGGTFTDCWIHNNTSDGLNNGGSAGGMIPRFLLDRCVISSNGGKGLNWKTSSTILSFGQISLRGCVVSGNTSDGITCAQTAVTVGYALTLENNIIQSNGGWGVNLTSTPSVLNNRNNAYRSNTSGNLNGISAGTNDVTLTGDPFTNAAGGDFSLNNTAGAGAACRAAGFPGAALFGTGYLDIGALQSQATGGSGGMLFVPNLEGT